MIIKKMKEKNDEDKLEHEEKKLLNIRHDSLFSRRHASTDTLYRHKSLTSVLIQKQFFLPLKIFLICK